MRIVTTLLHANDKENLVQTNFDEKKLWSIMHLSMGGRRAYVGHLTFQKNFWSKSPLWGPKTWSYQIKYPQVFDQFTDIENE